MENTELTVYTSQSDWFAKVAVAYRKKSKILLIDDANLGINPAEQPLVEMLSLGNSSLQDWAGVLVSLGISAAGIRFVVAAIIDPEPTSKLGLLVASGAILAFCGGFSAIRIITTLKPPSVEISKTGIKIGWE